MHGPSALAVALILVLAGGKPADAGPTRIAYSSISGAMLPLWVAKDKGLFDKYGVEVELAYIRGADLAIIANTINVAVFSLMSKPDLKRPEDLKGKKIGVTNLGDSPDLVLSLLLEKWGLQRNKDVAVLGIRGGMPELLISVSKGFVDAGMISAPSNLRGMKLGLREFVNVADLGIPYLNSPLSTRRSYIKTHRDVVLRVLRAYYQAVQETRNNRNSALKILAKYVRVDDTEILSEVYRIYGTNHLQKNLTIDLEGIKGLLNGLGSEATQVDPTAFIDISLLQDLDCEGFFQAKNR